MFSAKESWGGTGASSGNFVGGGKPLNCKEDEEEEQDRERACRRK